MGSEVRISKRLLRGLALTFAGAFLAFTLVQWWDLTLPRFGHEQYQAVFLANGQTYFGRFYDRLGPYAKIEQPYYIQRSQGASGEPAEDRLVRRGGELHAPVDRMLIPKDTILFVEDLGPSSAVARFMDQDQARRR